MDLKLFKTPIGQLTSHSMTFCPPETTLRETANYFKQLKEKKNVPVVAFTGSGEQGVDGLFTEKDFFRRVYPILEEFLVGRGSALLSDHVTRPVDCHDSQEPLRKLIRDMAIKELRIAPIFDGETEIYSVISPRSILSFLMPFFPDELLSKGVKVDWDLLEVNVETEDINFGQKDEKNISGNIFLKPLKKAIFREVVKIDYETSLLDALEAMYEVRRGSVVITKYDCIVKGIFTESDFIYKVLNRSYEELKKLKISDVMTPNVHTLLGRHIISYAFNNMMAFNYRRVVIVDEEKYPLSIVTLLDIIKFLNHQLPEVIE